MVSYSNIFNNVNAASRQIHVSIARIVEHARYDKKFYVPALRESCDLIRVIFGGDIAGYLHGLFIDVFPCFSH
ncbi:Uncharacterised protein [uncultured archaeon]|nr:Uncharacterised protein [uncultured archaeon]